MKHWKILISAATIAVVANLSFADDVKTSFPKGWEVYGTYPAHYGVTVDSGLGKSSSDKFISLHSIGEVDIKDYVAITRNVDVSQYRGRGAALSVRFKMNGYNHQKDMWLRFFDDTRELIHMDIEPIGAYDPNRTASIRGAAAFFRVPQGATKMEVGFGLRGKGNLEISDLMFTLGEERNTAAVEENRNRTPMAQLISNKGVMASIDELNQTLKK